MKAALLTAALLAGAPAALGQGRGIVLQAQPPASPLPASPLLTAPPASPALRDFQPAPLPNRDYEAPAGPRASNAPQVAPGLFTRRELYRGEGFSRGSTSESDTERHVKPGAGFNLRMPLQPQ